MKLLLIARPFAFHGGIERATEGLLGALVEAGHDVHLLTPGGRRRRPGVTLHRLPLPPLPATGRVLALAAAARVAVARGAWDVVQSHERTLCQDVYRAGEGCHRAYLASVEPAGGRALYHRVVLALERRVFARTPRIVAIAHAGCREIRSLYDVGDDRLSVIYNGVDLERFHPGRRLALGPAARVEAGVPAGAPAMLFVGSGFRRKGLAVALRALAAFPDARARLIVAGKGDLHPYRALADRLGVGSRVAWLGARPDVERWYAAADVVVLPSLYEPFGNVHLEALASGVPVVTSRLAGGSEVLEEGVSGAVVDPSDAGAVAAGLERVLALPPPTRLQAARRAAEPFTYRAQAEAFGRIYGGLSGAEGRIRLRNR